MSQDNLHRWVHRKLGSAALQGCSINSHHKGRIEWANINRKYYRILTDWIALCKACHRIFDDRKLTVEQLRNIEINKQIILKGL